MFDVIFENVCDIVRCCLGRHFPEAGAKDPKGRLEIKFLFHNTGSPLATDLLDIFPGGHILSGQH